MKDLPIPETFFISFLPFRWAIQEGYGAKLINNPELIKDIVRQTVSHVPGFPVSIKIRIHENIRLINFYFQTSKLQPLTKLLVPAT